MRIIYQPVNNDGTAYAGSDTPTVAIAKLGTIEYAWNGTAWVTSNGIDLPMAGLGAGSWYLDIDNGNFDPVSQYQIFAQTAGTSNPGGPALTVVNTGTLAELQIIYPWAPGLISLADYKTFYGTVPWTDGQINMMIMAITQQIGSLCHRNFVVQAYDEWYRVADYTKLVLNQYPIVSVESIAQYNTQQDAGSPIINYDIYDPDAGMISFDGNDSILHYLTSYSAIVMNMDFWYRVQYHAGLAVIPLDLQMIAMEMVTTQLASAQRDKNIRDEKIGEYRYRVEDPAMAALEFERRLAPYRKVRL
jgi:hypothetical protein